MLKTVIALLNGADVAGVGQLQFNRMLNRFIESKMGLINNRGVYGHRIIMGCMMSGVR